MDYRPLPSVPWSRHDIVWGAIVGLGLLGGLTVLFGLGLNAYARFRGQGLSSASGVVSLLAELTLLLPVWWLGLRQYQLPWSTVGLRPFPLGRSLGLGLVFLLLAFLFNVAWSLFLAGFGLSIQPNLLPLFGSSIGGLLLALLAGGLIAPIAEEVFFRGFIFAGLHEHLGLQRALLLSAALFALVHVYPPSWPPIFLLGVLFALLYERTGSIWPAIVIHGAVNSISFLALYVLASGSH